MSAFLCGVSGVGSKSYPCGIRSVLIANLASGLWLPFPPLDFRSRLAERLILLYEWVLLLFSGGQLLVTAILLATGHKDLSSWESLLQIVVSVQNLFHSTVRSVLLRRKRGALISLLRRVHRLLGRREFRLCQGTAVARTSRAAGYILALLMAIYILGQVHSAVTIYSSIMYPLASSWVQQYGLMVIGSLGNTLSYLKIISQDALFIGILYLATEQLRLLRVSLRPAVLATLAGSKERGVVDLPAWISYQQALARLVGSVNTLTSPVVLLTMVSNTLVMCLLAFVSARSAIREVSLSSLQPLQIIYCVITLLQTVLYCEAGDRLRQESSRVSEAAHRGPWLGAPPDLVSGLQLLALDCRRSFVARGGPFFILSLEFFASVVGAVLTYFIVLLQFK